MDWKYKHFHQERTFEAPQDLVAEAARKYFVESLGWQITKEAEGFNAEGYGFSHKCIARLQFPSDANATKVVIDLTVNRAGGRGFMLFDVGGYYNIQMRHWLDGTQANLHTILTPQSISSPNPVPPPHPCVCFQRMYRFYSRDVRAVCSSHFLRSHHRPHHRPSLSFRPRRDLSGGGNPRTNHFGSNNNVHFFCWLAH
jgi:hypothetical protein